MLVVRPAAPPPDAPASTLESSGPPEVLADAWGSALLVKTGRAAYRSARNGTAAATSSPTGSIPFLARCEAFLPIRTPSTRPVPPARATLISSFLGGDLLHPEPLDEVIRGAIRPRPRPAAARPGLRHARPLADPAATHPLGRWRRVYRGNDNDWLLFGKFDLTRDRRPRSPTARDEFAAGLRWDTSFIEGEAPQRAPDGQETRRPAATGSGRSRCGTP